MLLIVPLDSVIRDSPHLLYWNVVCDTLNSILACIIVLFYTAVSTIVHLLF